MSDYIANHRFDYRIQALMNEEDVADHVALMQLFGEPKRKILTYIMSQLPGKIGKGRGKRHKKLHVKSVDVFHKYLDASPHTWKQLFGPFNPMQVVEIAKTLDWTKYRKSKLSCANMTLLFLHRMHTGCSLSVSAVTFGISISVAQNIFHFVFHEFLQTYDHLIRWPSEEEEAQIRWILLEVCIYRLVLCKK